MKSSFYDIEVRFGIAYLNNGARYLAQITQLKPQHAILALFVATPFVVSGEIIPKDLQVLLFLSIILLVTTLLGFEEGLLVLLAFGVWEGAQQQQWTLPDLLRASFVLIAGLFVILVRPAPGIQVVRARAEAEALRLELKDAQHKEQHIHEFFVRSVGSGHTDDGRACVLGGRREEVIDYCHEELECRTASHCRCQASRPAGCEQVAARLAVPDQSARENVPNADEGGRGFSTGFVTRECAGSNGRYSSSECDEGTNADQFDRVRSDDILPLQTGGSLAHCVRRDLTVKELSHRLENIFPVILTLVRMTAEHHPGGASLAEALQHRISALSLTHRLMAQRIPTAFSIAELVRLEVEPYGLGDRLELAGPDIKLTRGMAESFAIIVHELVTNSAKHGALKSSVGRLDVAWCMVREESSPQVVFEWIEKGGSPPDPTRKPGFGASILGFANEPIVGSGATFRATEDGVHYVLTLRLGRDP